MPDYNEHEPMMQWFDFSHLRPELQTVSYHFAQLANYVTENLPRDPERTMCLRKLLEAKDRAVRASLYRYPASLSAPRDAVVAAPPADPTITGNGTTSAR